MKRFLILLVLPFLAFADDGLINESELGVVLTTGNSKTETLSAKHTSKYTFSENKLVINAKYLYGKASGVESAKNWLIGLRYERSFSPSLSGFLGNSWESDTFNGFDYRTNVDAGAKYFLIQEDATKKGTYLLTEGGYRYTYESRVPGVSPQTEGLHFARIYLEGSQLFSETTTGKLWVEALPSLNNSNSTQFNFEGSIAVAMSQTLSLKAAYLGKYRNTALKVGGEKFDSTLTTSLIAKF